MTTDSTSGAGAAGYISCCFSTLKSGYPGEAPHPACPPLSCPLQMSNYGDMDEWRPELRNSSSRKPPSAVEMDRTLTLSSEQKQPEGLLSPLASPLCPLEVQGLVCGPRYPSLPEHLSSVPKQLEFQRHGSDPGFLRS